MTNEIKVIILEAENDEAIIVEKWEHSLENLQQFVGGYIEAVRVTDSITLWINEEGKLEGLEPNFHLCRMNGMPYDLVVGDVLIAGTDEEGNTVSLTDDEIKEVQERFLSRRHFNMMF